MISSAQRMMQRPMNPSFAIRNWSPEDLGEVALGPSPCIQLMTEGRARTGPVAAGRRLAPGRVSPRFGGPPPSRTRR
jgi:hypothetical protein